MTKHTIYHAAPDEHVTVSREPSMGCGSEMLIVVVAILFLANDPMNVLFVAIGIVASFCVFGSIYGVIKYIKSSRGSRYQVCRKQLHGWVVRDSESRKAVFEAKGKGSKKKCQKWLRENT